MGTTLLRTDRGAAVLAVEIEGYRIESECAAGSGFQLLRARQIVADAPVLLQLWEGPAAEARSAIRTLAGLRHPGLATVLDVGETRDGRTYAALAALTGPSLSQRLSAGLDLDQSLALLRRLALVLQFLESRCGLQPCLEPGAVLTDAQDRPVLTRLLGANTLAEPGAPTRALIHLFHEALTGNAILGERPQLPDYLCRWQPMFDLLAEFDPLTPAHVLETLDRLQGRSAEARTLPSVRAPAAAAAARTAASAPPRTNATEHSGKANAEPAVPRTPAAEGMPKPPPATPKVLVPVASDPRVATGPAPTPTPAAAAAAPAAPKPLSESANAPGRTPSPTSKETVAASPASARIEQITAPSRRLDSEPARNLPGVRALPEAELPAPPSRLPLILAVALAVPVLAGLVWWLASSDPAAKAPSSVAAAPSPSVSRSAEASRDPPEQSQQGAGPAVVWQLSDPAADELAGLTQTFDLQTLPTVEDPLERLLLYARTNVQAGRLVEPPGRNALDRYLQALRIEPANRAARNGIADLGALCLSQATDADALDARLLALGCVERIAAAHEAGATAAEGAQALRQSEHDRFLVAGQQALAGWRPSEASAHYANALRLLPDSADARAGVREAEQQGRPGYRFRDALSGGGRSPELVVAGGLGWGRSEIRVDEFEAYWAAAGRARFGADMPACRDRESMLRSSRKRDWRTPDFPQTPAHPVACVSFGMAQHYVEWLSEASGQRYRLPSLAEWQALAGSAPSDCRANFRDQSAARAWNARDAAACDDGHPHTAPVQASGDTAGLLGLWGNLAEWLSDCEGSNCRQRLAAGGSWFSTQADALPRGFAAEPGFTTIGFRVVRELPARD